jgi:photosystem II stability/assembly factor-like uncharacterized protein
MKSKIFTSILFIAAFLMTFQAVMRLDGWKSPGPADPAKNERLEATHAWQALRWYNDQRAYPTGKIPADWREKALAHVERNNLMKTSSENSVTWTGVGPNAIGGRVRSIVINPLNPNTIYCGSVSGGIWKSTNAGGSWFPTSDLAANLVIGTMVIDPTDTNTIYAGTGEGYFNVDALRGAGVLKSTDGGGHWTLQTNFPGAVSPNFYYYINKLVIRPDAHLTLYAALLGGIWRTTDGGSNWTKLTVATSSTGCMDLVANPFDYNTLYASFGLFVSDGVYKSTNGGTTWSKLTNGFPAPSTKYGRISLGISPASPSTLYACLTDSNYFTHSIQKTTNGGASWFAVATPFDNSAAVNGTHLGGQGWYNNYIAVHPTDSNTVFTGGINNFRSTNGGASWSRISDGYGSPYVHVDQHAIAFDPTLPSVIYIGNDGGMFKTLDGGASFSAINNNLGITQFYSGAVHPTSEIYYGGTQDNGTLRATSPPSWSISVSGDGGATAVDFTTPTTVYTEYVYLSILKSTSSGNPNSWTKAMSGIPTTGGNLSDGTSDRCEFIAPLVMDPTNSQVLVAGTYRIFRTTNGGSNWTSISADLTGDGTGSVGSSGSVISTIAVAKSSPSTIYIGTSGSVATASRVCVTTNTGASWTDVTKAPLPNLYVRSIAVDPANNNRAIVTYSGYGSGHVYLTTNRGSTWTNASGDLPDLPVNTIVVDPSNTGHWIIGTDLGVFETNNTGTNWIQQNSGLANVSVADLDMRGDLYLFAATHGRGMFKTTAPINVAARIHLTLPVHQNPVLSQYVDIYVLSDTALQGLPAMQVTGATEVVPLAQTSPGVFRASYQLTASGTVTISASALDPGGNTLSAQRTFQATLAKQGIAQTVSSPDGDASLEVPAGALAEDTYFTVVPDESAGGTIRSRLFTIGPAREFQTPLTISIGFNSSWVEPGKEGSLTIVRSDGSGWVPIESWVDLQHRSVNARVSSLGTFAVAVSGSNGSEILPEAYRLAQNYPNPFNPVTSIEYALREPAHALLRVYDVTGREIATLADRDQGSGNYRISWDGRGSGGTAMSSGVYFYRLSVMKSGKTAYTSTKKMLLAR